MTYFTPCENFCKYSNVFPPTTTIAKKSRDRLSLVAHTHTHTLRERERERDQARSTKVSGSINKFLVSGTTGPGLDN
jgi:hypothetical protein